MTQLDLFSQQTPSEAFARRFAAQPGFGGFAGFNPIQNQAFNALGNQSIANLPFGQGFSLFGAGGLLPQFQGLSGADLAQRVQGRDAVFDQMINRNNPRGFGADVLQNRLGSAVSALNANAASVLGQPGAAPISPALALLLGEIGNDPGNAAALSIAPFIQGLPPALRGAVMNTILGRFGDFSAVNPETNILDTFNRFQGAGFF